MNEIKQLNFAIIFILFVFVNVMHYTKSNNNLQLMSKHEKNGINCGQNCNKKVIMKDKFWTKTISLDKRNLHFWTTYFLVPTYIMFGYNIHT